MSELNQTNTVIMTCTSLLLHVKAAQEKMGTEFEIVELDRHLHVEPKKMRERIIETMSKLPDRVENVLVSMGFCGGSWDNVEVHKRVVIPRVDDCITLLLHTDDTPHINLKKKGHMYFRDCDGGEYSIEAMKNRLCSRYGTDHGTAIFESWFESYTNADIIDTGVYDCHSAEYVEEAQKNADLIRCTLGYVQGSNRILEKLVSGCWDEQFIVLEPGSCVKMQSLSEIESIDEENGGYI